MTNTSLTMRYLLIFMLVCTGLVPAFSQESTSWNPGIILEAGLDDLDSLALRPHTLYQLVEVAGAAKVLLQDSAFDRQIKGEVCLMLLADELQYRSRQDEFDAEDPVVQHLVSVLADYQYFLALTKPSDLAKLQHYLAEGRYGYIAKRVVDRGYHVYLVLVLLASGGVGMVWFRRRRKKLPKAESMSSTEEAL